MSEAEFNALHGALGAEVAELVIGSTPTADVMRDGRVRRIRRRVAVTCGMATLAVLPVAAVAAFAGTGGTKGVAATAAPSPKTTSANPPPIVVSPPKPGQLNPALPNDSIVVLASGTADGKQWRLVRDRYVVAGPEPTSVMGDPSSRPHLPYAANWDKPGTIECDFTGVQWGGGAPGGRNGGGGCNPTDDGSVARLIGRFQGGGGTTYPLSPSTVEGRIDGTDVAYLTVDIDGVNSGKQPVIQVLGEKNDYYMVLMPKAAAYYKLMTITLYDAHGKVIESEMRAGMSGPGSIPSSGSHPSPGAK